jgi:quercetin dioxygenase-like cupin family protein
MKPVRWFALVAAATVQAAMVSSPAAFATPAVNTEVVVISQATLDGVEYITRAITIQPGGSTGWHFHDGQVFGVVRSGTLTRTFEDCADVVSPVGSPVTEESGPDHIHNGRNLGPDPVMLWIDYIQPAGTPLSVDVPGPPGCPIV